MRTRSRGEVIASLLEERPDGVQVILAQKARFCLQEREMRALNGRIAVEHRQRGDDTGLAVAPVMHTFAKKHLTRMERCLMRVVVADGGLRDPVLIITDDRHLTIFEGNTSLQGRLSADCRAQAVVASICHDRDRVSHGVPWLCRSR